MSASRLRLRLRRPLVLGVGLGLFGAVGCTEDYALSDDSRGEDSEVAPFDPDADVSELRIDVYPAPDLYADAEGAPTLLPQTFDVVLASQNELRMSNPVTLTGLVAGVAVSPWLAADLPGQTVPVRASVTIGKGDSIQGGATISGEDGAFGLLLAPELGYQIAVVPDRPDVPMWVAPLDVVSAADLTVAIPAGAALWGQVQAADGAPLPGAAVRAVHASGVVGPWTHADADGAYILRVLPGEWRVQTQGRQNGRDPLLTSAPVLVDEIGASTSFRYASLVAHGIGGRISGPTGPLQGVTVRLRSEALDGYEGEATVSVDLTTNAPGNFDTRLPAGTYTIEVVPARGVALSPRALNGVRIASDTDVGTVLLARMDAVSTRLLDEAGQPVPGATLQATEVGFGRRTLSAQADADGWLDVELPDVPLSLVLVPPSDRADLAMRRLVIANGGALPEDLALPTGQLLSGRLQFNDGSRVRAVQSAVVEVIDRQGQLQGVAITDGDGRFETPIAWPPAER